MYIAFFIALLSIISAYYIFRSEVKSKSTPFDDESVIQKHETSEGIILGRVIVDDFYTGCVKKLVIGVESPLDLQFNFSKEKWYEKLFKTVGFITEYQTLDKYFDKNVYIASDVEDLHAVLAQSAPLRDKILQILTLDFPCDYKYVAVKNRFKMIWLEIECKPKIKPKKFNYDDMILPIQVLLTDIRDEFSKHVNLKNKEEKVLKKSHFLQHSIFGLWAMTLTLIISDSFVVWPSLVYVSDMFFYLFLVSFLFVVGLMLVLTKKYVKSSWTHKTIARYFLVLLIVSLYPGFSMLKLVNATFDTSEVSKKEFLVIDRYKTIKSPRYYLYVNNWRNTNEKAKLRVPGSLYDAKVIRVESYEGFLNVEWISKINRVERK